MDGGLGLSRRRLPKLASPSEAQTLDFLAPDLSSSNWEVIVVLLPLVFKFITGSQEQFRAEQAYNKSQS